MNRIYLDNAATTAVSPAVLEAMRRASAREKIPGQNELMLGGGTDAGRMAETRGGMAVGGISLPTRYTHSPVEICDKNDYLACVRLVAALAETEF